MRILHTADWHLGRLFHQIHLTEDQAHVLAQFVALASDTRPDIVLIAGDIYDRAVPPPEAVALLDETLSQLALDCRVPVMVIAGNHDSPQRLHFASRLLTASGVHLLGACSSEINPLILSDDAGPVRFYALPYAEPAVVRGEINADVHDHDAAMRAQLDRIRAAHPAGERAVLLAHAFVAGGEATDDSERPLSVGNTGAVNPDCFAGFDYVALGHLHRPQMMDGGRLRYAGSLLKYSFAESSQPKSVSLVEMDARGGCTVEEISLSPRHDVRRIAGNLRELLEHPEAHGNRNDYLEVTLLDSGAILDAMGKLREVFPNVLHIERPETAFTGNGQTLTRDHRALDPAELFCTFFLEATGEEISDEQSAAFAQHVDRLYRTEREAVLA